VYFRPAEVDLLIADPSKAMKQLGWKPRVTLDELVHEMMDHEFQELQKGTLIFQNDQSERQVGV